MTPGAVGRQRCDGRTCHARGSIGGIKSFVTRPKVEVAFRTKVADFAVVIRERITSMFIRRLRV
jgi:hypothetical protein